jgi:hypothetical protein
MVRIQLETGYLDVKEGTSFPLNFQVGDIRDLTQRKGTFSKTITLSGTKNNNTLLNNYYDINISSGNFDINKLTRCSVLQNGIPIVTNALLQLVNVKKVQLTDAYEQGLEYEVLVRDSQAEFYTTITNLELTDLDFSDCNHEFSITSITDSWSHTQSDNYKYLMPYNDTANYTVNHFKPAIYAKSYFDRIFANAGFTYDWSNLTDFHFDKLLIPYNGDVNNFDFSDYRVTAQTTYLSSFAQPNPGYNESFTQQVTTWTETLDNQSLFNPSLGEYNTPFNTDTTQGQTYFFNFIYAYEIILDNASTSPPFTAYLKVQDPTTLLYQNAQIQYNLQFELLVNGSGVGFVQASDDVIVGDGITSISIPPSSSLSVLTASGTTTIPIPINITATDIVEIKVGINVTSLYNFGVDAVWRSTNATSGGSNVQVNPQVNFSSLKLDVVPSNNIQVIGGTQVINEFIPLKIKQSDFVKAIFQMYNLYAYPNTNQPNELILVQRDEWYDAGTEKDWSTKLAKNQEQQLIFLPDLSKKKLKLTYKPDTDTANDVYTQATAETYGQLEYTFDNEYVKDTDTKELLFSPTPVNKTSFDAYLPMINGIAPNTNIRILYDSGLETCQPFNIYEQGTTGTTGLTSYPQTGHFNNALTPTFDINFGVCDYYFYQTSVLTNNNLYNLYWRRTVNQINVGKMLITSFLLNEADIQTLKLNDKIRIDNSWWNINKVIDYNANDEVLTKIELISVDTEIELANFRIKRPIPIGDILDSKGTSEMNIVITEQSNINLSEGNVQVFGKGNVIPSGLKGIVIGDNQSVTEDGITTTNLTVTETINGQSVTEILPTYTKYIALISQTGILDPTVIILENTIGDIIFSRIGAGYYEATLTGAFLINKTWVVGGSADNTAGSGDFATLDIRRISDNVISLRTYDNFSPFDDMLVNTSIEIRVYP